MMKKGQNEKLRYPFNHKSIKDKLTPPPTNHSTGTFSWKIADQLYEANLVDFHTQSGTSPYWLWFGTQSAGTTRTGIYITLPVTEGPIDGEYKLEDHLTIGHAVFSPEFKINYATTGSAKVHIKRNPDSVTGNFSAEFKEPSMTVTGEYNIVSS